MRSICRTGFTRPQPWGHAGDGVGSGLYAVLSAPRAADLFLIVTPWEIGVILTANYAFLNYLVLALGFLLLDDKYLLRFVPARFRPRAPEPVPETRFEAAGDSADFHFGMGTETRRRGGASPPKDGASRRGPQRDAGIFLAVTCVSIAAFCSRGLPTTRRRR